MSVSDPGSASPGAPYMGGSQSRHRVSLNAIAAPAVVVPPAAGALALTNSVQIVRTPLPVLKSGESGASAVTDNTVSSVLCRGRFQISGVPGTPPTQLVACINLRHTDTGAYVTNIGFWYMIGFGAGIVPNLSIWNYEWPYIPFNNIPSAPFAEVGDGTNLDVSLDIATNNVQVGNYSVANGLIVAEAGNFYTPGTTQIGNSAAPGPIGVK